MPRQTDFETYPRLYTAGAMRWVDHEDSYWRRSIEEDLPHVAFYHPEEGYFDHGGDMVDGAVAEDISAIQAADGLVAYLDETPQIGTVTEVLHAAHTGTPVLVLLEHGSEAIPERASFGSEVPCEVPPIGMRYDAPDFWFLINYLVGEGGSATQRTFPNWLSDWEGKPQATVMAVGEDDVTEVVAGWVEETFGTIPTGERGDSR